MFRIPTRLVPIMIDRFPCEDVSGEGSWKCGRCLPPPMRHQWALAFQCPRPSLCAKAALRCNDEKATRLSHSRLSRMSAEASYSAELMELDEAVEVLDRNDIKVVQSEKESAQRACDIRAEYSRLYRASAAKFLPASGKHKRRRKASEAALPEVIPQAEARNFVPEGSHVWRGNFAQTWNGHLKPYRRVSCRWSLHGEHQALKLVLASLWRQYIELHGLAADACPYAELRELPEL